VNQQVLAATAAKVALTEPPLNAITLSRISWTYAGIPAKTLLLNPLQATAVALFAYNTEGSIMDLDSPMESFPPVAEMGPDGVYKGVWTVTKYKVMQPDGTAVVGIKLSASSKSAPILTVGFPDGVSAIYVKDVDEGTTQKVAIKFKF